MKSFSRSLAVPLSIALIMPVFGGISVLADDGVPIDEDHFPDPVFRELIEMSMIMTKTDT